MTECYTYLFMYMYIPGVPSHVRQYVHCVTTTIY